MAITTAINDLFSSIYELIASILGTFYAIIHSFITAILGFVQGIFTLTADVLNGLVDVAGGVGKFIASTSSNLHRFHSRNNGADYSLRQHRTDRRWRRHCSRVCQVHCSGAEGCDREESAVGVTRDAPHTHISEPA